MINADIRLLYGRLEDTRKLSYLRFSEHWNYLQGQIVQLFSLSQQFPIGGLLR
jgi:hypothetical protein